MDIKNVKEDKINPIETLKSLFDKDSFVELFSSLITDNMFVGYGTVYGRHVCAFIQNSSSKSGAVDSKVLLKTSKIYELAKKTGCAIVGFLDSKGADLNEGLSTISQYSKWLSFVNNLSGVVPQVSVVLGNCGTTQAMVATSTDFIIMKQDAKLYFNPPFVTGGNCDGKSAMEEGLAHIVVKTNAEAIKKTRDLLCYLPENNLAIPYYFDFERPNKSVSLNLSGLDLIEAVFDLNSIVELQNDYDKSIITAFATIDGMVCAIIATDKIKITKNGALKAARFIRFCDCFSIPIVTFYNSQGFDQDNPLTALKSVSALSYSYFEATCPKICVLTGDAYGSSLVAFCSKELSNDFVLAYDNISISSISPEAYVELFKKDKISEITTEKDLIDEFKKGDASSSSAGCLGLIDNIINPLSLRDELISHIDILKDKKIECVSKKHGNLNI